VLFRSVRPTSGAILMAQPSAVAPPVGLGKEQKRTNTKKKGAVATGLWTIVPYPSTQKRW
jgi:hypothetical protein